MSILKFIWAFTFSFFAIPLFSVTWVGGASNNNWSDTLNWSTHEIPTCTDDVFIPGDGYLVVVDIQACAKSIELSAGSTLQLQSSLILSAASVLAANSTLVWKSGTLASSTYEPLTNYGHIQLQNNANKTMGIILKNYGTITLEDQGDLHLNGSVVYNYGTFSILSDAGLGNTNSNLEHELNNYGVFEKTGGSGVSHISAHFNNLHGTVKVLSGELSVDSGGELTGGSYEVSSGSTLSLKGYVTHDLFVSDTLTGTGLGSVIFRGQVRAVDSVFLNFSGSGLYWKGGTWGGGGKFVNLKSLHLDGTGNKSLVWNTTLENRDILDLTNSGNFVLHGVLDNYGVFTLLSDANISSASNMTHELNNYGIFQKSAGTGISDVYAVVVNEGSIFAHTGTIRFQYSFTALPGSTLGGAGAINFSGQTISYEGNVSPGNSPGKLSLIGNFSFQAGTVFSMELNGTEPVLDYDQLEVSGNMDINSGSSIEVSLGFSPSPGDVFTIFTAGSMGSCFLPSQVQAVFNAQIHVFNVVCNTSNAEVQLVYQGVLPVELVDFSARLDDDKAVLTWMTAAEYENEGFEIQRTGDLEKWDVRGFVYGQGTSDQFVTYQFEDELPDAAGTYYYRLKQVDFDGYFDYSSVESVYWEGRVHEISVFPSPASSHLRLVFSTRFQEPLRAELFDLLGHRIRVFQLEEQSTLLSLTGLSKGLYFLQIEGVPEVLFFVKE